MLYGSMYYTRILIFFFFSFLCRSSDKNQVLQALLFSVCPSFPVLLVLLHARIVAAQSII